MDNKGVKTGYLFHGDILGFKKIIETLEISELNKRINIFLSMVKNIGSKNGIEKDNIKIFSDTIIVYIDDPSQFHNLVTFSKELLEECIKESFPIRGAITHGQFIWDEIVYGPAALRAYKLENLQDWIGVVIDNNISPNLLKSENITYPPPFKPNESVMLYRSIKWKVPLYRDLMKYLTSHGLGGVPGSEICWNLFNIITNSIIFAIYSEGNNDPTHFQGTSPIEFIEHTLRK